MIYLSELRRRTPDELRAFAHSIGVDTAGLKKEKLIFDIFKQLTVQGHSICAEGVVEVLSDGFGFLRYHQSNYLPSPSDIYIAPSYIQNHRLLTGSVLSGVISAPTNEETHFSLEKILSINLTPGDQGVRAIPFESLTPLFPTRRIHLELPLETGNVTSVATRKHSHSLTNQSLILRSIDLIAPLGFGQRALIVAPPRTGKTVIMQALIKAIQVNHPQAFIMVLLIDERPEEVTEMERFVKGEVIASTFDEPAERHIQVAEMVIEKAKRLVEAKKDVVIFLDSITRLARAYNTVVPSSGKTLTGGVDSGALQKPKRLFGAARNVEEGGSLTIIGTALVETGSRMEEVIFEEFKGTGNSEIHLDRKLAERRIFPAIDVGRSGTRKEELLVEEETIKKRWVLRRVLGSMGQSESAEFLLDKLRQTKTNGDLFDVMNKPLGQVV
jgi:transcription termination factor Rho